MKVFIRKMIIFCGIFSLLACLALALPPTPKSSDYYLFSKISKDSLMSEIESPRLILVGGSNLVFGLNSQILKDSLGINPINAGVTATVGLVYMMDNTLEYCKEGDIVIIAPEYHHFFGKFAYGANDLLRLLMDVDRSGFKKLQKQQWINILKKTPNYMVSKYNLKEYFFYEINPVYGINIFNNYGDSNYHWELNGKEFQADDISGRILNKKIFDEIDEFQSDLENKGVNLFITYPCFQDISFDLNEKEILEFNKELNKRSYKILGNPERYRMHDSLMFDTPYHLIKKGVDLRSFLLVEDLKEQLGFNIKN